MEEAWIGERGKGEGEAEEGDGGETAVQMYYMREEFKNIPKLNISLS